jgi:hypothetical protein
MAVSLLNKKLDIKRRLTDVLMFAKLRFAKKVA